MTHKPSFRASRNTRRLTPAGYIMLGVGAVLLLIVALSACGWIDRQIVHPYGQDVPPALAATFTPLAVHQDKGTPETQPPRETSTPTGQAPWAGKRLPGQLLPEVLVSSIEADWDALVRTTLSYEHAQDNALLGDKAWWMKQMARFYTGQALRQQTQYVEGWFSPGASTFPVFIESLEYAVTVTDCASDTECQVTVQVQGKKAWLYNVERGEWLEGIAVDDYRMEASMVYNPDAQHWQCQSFK